MTSLKITGNMELNIASKEVCQSSLTAEHHKLQLRDTEKLLQPYAYSTPEDTKLWCAELYCAFANLFSLRAPQAGPCCPTDHSWWPHNDVSIHILVGAIPTAHTQHRAAPLSPASLHGTARHPHQRQEAGAETGCPGHPGIDMTSTLCKGKKKINIIFCTLTRNQLQILHSWPIQHKTHL